MSRHKSAHLTRSDVAEILGVHITTIRRMERQHILNPVLDRRTGVHYFDREEVAALAAARGKTMKTSGALAARVYKLIREGKSLGEIVLATELTPDEVRALYTQFTTPLHQPTPEQRDADERRQNEENDREMERWERERKAKRNRG